MFWPQVDQGLQTGLTPGMKLEVCARSEPDSPYWVANIITTCGQLLLLRYEGYQDDRRADFWCDIMTADLHPLGWSRQHGKTMRAPEGETGFSPPHHGSCSYSWMQWFNFECQLHVLCTYQYQTEYLFTHRGTGLGVGRWGRMLLGFLRQCKLFFCYHVCPRT